MKIPTVARSHRPFPNSFLPYIYVAPPEVDLDDSKNHNDISYTPAITIIGFIYTTLFILIMSRTMCAVGRSARIASSVMNHHHPTMPPGFTATVGNIQTFTLPEKVNGNLLDRRLANAMVSAWRKDGILQIAMSPSQRLVYEAADASSRAFFRKPSSIKRACVDDKSYAGYIASGEEITNGIADYSEIFTVTKDLALSDPRVAANWPCHGPCPWPEESMRLIMMKYMEGLSKNGEALLRLIEMGLGVPEGSLTRYTADGWHHMRVLRFPHKDATNVQGKKGRGIGSHTDYGLLVMASQDDVGGLFVRPPEKYSKTENWQHSTAGYCEEDAGWVYVPPTPGVFTVFPGDMMQYMTNNALQSTPHKVGLNTRERFAFAYFHEPNFRAVIKPLPGYNHGQAPQEGIHYGTHFTNMCLRNYPDRVTTSKMMGRDGYTMLSRQELRQRFE